MGTVLKPVVGTNVGTEAIKNPQPVDLQRIADVEVAGFEYDRGYGIQYKHVISGVIQFP